MNPFQRPQITDELLSAYVDGDVTVEERNLIERAIQRDANLAWRLESLQQTVGLLRSLPELSLPRSFLLTEADVAPKAVSIPAAPIPRLVASASNPANSRIVKPRIVETEPPGFWQSFLDFWRGGSPLLRNMATAGLTIWLVLFGATLLNPTQFAVNTTKVDVQTMNAPQTAQAELTAAQPATDSAAAPPIEATQVVAAVAQAQIEPATQSALPQSLPVDNGTQSETLAFSTQDSAQDNTRSSDPARDMSGGMGGGMGGGSEPEAGAALTQAPALTMDAPSAPGQADPLAQAMGDTGDNAMSAANANPADTNVFTGSDVITAAAFASPLVAKQSGETPPVENQQDDTSTAVVDNFAQVEPTPAAPLAATQVSPTATSAPIQVEQVAPVIEPTPTQPAQEPAQPAAVAIVQPDTKVVAPEAESRQAELVEQATSSPLFDPMRMQFAQLLVALVTAVLGIFWLASQWGERRR